MIHVILPFCASLYMEKVVLSIHFSKLSTRATQELDAKELGYLAKLSNNLEYETNRLVIMENGKRNKGSRRRY